MPRPTARGITLLIVAAATYATARVFGTWELYLLALAFAAMTGISWLLVRAGSRRLWVDRTVEPQQPVAGDPLRFSFRVGGGRAAGRGGGRADGRKRPGLRVPGLQLTLIGATGEMGPGEMGPAAPVVVDGVGSRGDEAVAAGPWPARRGVHHLPAFTAVVEDALGLARARRVTGEPLRVTVAPRLEELSSCAPCTASGVRHGGGRRRLPTRDAWELRGIRPHEPGESLDRVDWKATAKTGSLMIREMESAADDDLTVVLAGGSANGSGTTDAAFETAVRAAGSMAAHALRAGRAVSLLLPEPEGKAERRLVQGWEIVRLRSGGAGRRRLLQALAEAEPGGPDGLGPSLTAVADGRGGRDGNRNGGRRRVLALVVLDVDEGLVAAALKLRRDSAAVSVIHVAEDGAAPRDGTPRGGAPAGAADPSRLRDALSAAGVHYARLARGNDLRVALAASSERPGRGRRRGRPGQQPGRSTGRPAEERPSRPRAMPAR